MRRASLLILLGFLWLAGAAQPSTQPILKIETGSHMAMANRVATDRAGTYVVTCSDDKTARLWDAATGRLLRTFRVPVGASNEGKVYSMALSPDGRFVALAGWTGYEWDKKNCIYILETQTGMLVKRMSGLVGVILEMEFSPDGSWLAAGLSEGGIAVYRAGSWTEQERLIGISGGVYGIAFAGNELMAATSEDGHLRIYRNFVKTADITDLGGEPRAIAASPDGSTLAMGYHDKAAVELRSATTGRLLKKYDNGDLKVENSGFESLSFSFDGSHLWGGGSFSVYSDADSRWYRFVRRWSDGGNGTSEDFMGFSNLITDLKPLPDGSMAVCTGFPEVGVLRPSGSLLWLQRAPLYNFASRNQSHFRISQDGTQVGITPFMGTPLSIDLRTRTMAQRESVYPSFSDRNGGSKVENWQNTTNGTFNSLALSTLLSRSEIARSVDVADDGSAVIGADWSVRRIMKDGKQAWSIDVPEVPWCINIAGNGRVVAVAYGDGTVRWHNMEDGKELLALYLSPENDRWILFTPSGYYDAAAGSEDLLGWNINNGPDAAPTFYPVSRYRETYYRPDIIDAILETYDEQRAITLANTRSNRTGTTAAPAAEVRQKRPPVVTILSPVAGSTVRSETVQVEYSLSTPDDAPVKSIKVLVNGRPVALQRGIQTNPSGKSRVTVAIPSTGESTITLLAESDNGLSPEANLFLRYEAPPQQQDAFVRKPKLYVLAVGISNYTNPDYKLNFADKDADAFVNGIRAQKGKLYGDVVVRKYLNADATRENIQDGLQWIQEQTGQGDVAMIFYAGHGINDNNGVFYMLPVGADVERVRSTCLNFEELRQTVSSIAGKVVVFIDACHSGNVMGSAQRRGGADINALVNELSSTQNGAITFTSSTGKEYSLEDPSWAHGAFTMALLEGLNGKASVSGKGKITVKSLDAYISERVKELTRGKQHPTSVVPPNVPDFPIAVF
ncbi:MAG: peptidase C14 [Chitinophagaceae bacterium]|nr:MAG: peptidase C14 [Chitinophagaceae bacterium]